MSDPVSSPYPAGDPAPAIVDGRTVERIDASTLGTRSLRYYDFAMVAFVVVLLLSNLIGASKLSTFNGSVYGAGILFFPLGYVLGDILTEVYGYARARRCVWMGFFAMLFMATMSYIVVALPPFTHWDCGTENSAVLKGLLDSHPTGDICQATYVAVFGNTWRLVLASIVAFWAGEFVNSFVLAQMKVWTGGRKLWARTIGSTIVGQGVDSLLFYPLAFYGVWSNAQVLTVLVTNWALKVLWEAVLTPVTYAVVGFLKRREGLDIYDTATDFTPFATRV